MPRWGAERRARPLHEVQDFMKSWASVLPQGGKEKGRAPHRFSMRPGGAPIGAPPPFFLREEFLGNAFWLGFSWRRQSSGAQRHRDNGWTHAAKGHLSKDIRAISKDRSGAATTHAKLSGAAHARRVAGAAIARAQRFGPARAVRFAGIVPLLRQEAVPPGAHMLRRRPRGVRLEALVPQEGQAEDAAERMEPARAPQIVVTPRCGQAGAAEAIAPGCPIRHLGVV